MDYNWSGFIYIDTQKVKIWVIICIKTEIPKEICEIDDELKAIYHSHDTVCIWVFKSREDRNNFMNDTVGMKKEEREKHYLDNYG